MNKYLRKSFKFLKISIITLLILFLTVSILIQVPRIQNWLVQKITNTLSNTFQAKINIQKVDLDFFKTAVLEGVFIEDQKADTLIFAKKLKTDIGIFSLLKKEIFLNSVQLEGAVSKLLKKRNENQYNFQFIIDAFDNKDEQAKKKKEHSSNWTFGIGEVIVKDSRFKMTDENDGGFKLQTSVGKLVIDAQTLDFSNKKIAVSELSLDKSSVDFTSLSSEQIPPNDTPKLAFPSFGWEIIANDLKLKESRFSFSNLNAEKQTNGVDYNYLNLKDISLNISDILFKNTTINAIIQKVAVRDHSGMNLNNLSTRISINNNNFTAKNLSVETQHSSVEGDIELSFDDFGDLFNFMEKVKLEANFQNSQIAYRDLTDLVSTLRNIPVMKTDVNETISLDGNISLEKNKISFEKFDGKIGEIFSLQASGSIAQLTSDPDFDLHVKNLQTDYHSFSYLTKNIPLPEGFAALGKIDFSGHLQGPINNLKGKDLSLITQSATNYLGDLDIRGLPDIEKTIFKVDAENLSVNSDDLQAITDTKFPSILDSLGLVRFQGNFEGTIHDFEIAGNFQTEAGYMETDLIIDFEKDYQNANYDGQLDFIDFDLSKILGNAFGPTSLNLSTKGSGLNVNDLNFKAASRISALNYNDYTYKNLSLNGNFLKKRFEGVAKAEDENLRFDFQGTIDLNDSLQDMRLSLNMDTINLEALNFYEKNLGFRGEFEANLKGNTPDNIEGTASLHNFKMAQDSVYYATQKTISLEALSPHFNQKSLHFRSEFLDANIKGQFNFTNFRHSIIDFVNGFFPIEELVLEDSSAQKQDQIKEQELTFDFKFKEITPLAKVFLPDFEVADTAYIFGNFNSEKKQFKMDGWLQKFVYGDIKVDTIHFLSTGNPNQLETILTMENTRSGGAINIPLLSFQTVFANDTLDFGFNVRRKVETSNFDFQKAQSYFKIDTSLQLNGVIAYFDETYSLSFLPEFILNNENWNIATENKITYDNNHLKISNLNIENNGKGIAINSVGIRPQNDSQPIEIRISDFDLTEISTMLGMKENVLGGMVNGNFIVKEPKTNFHYNSEVLIEKLALNDKPIGNLAFKATQASQASDIDLSIQLSGENQMAANGNYAINKQVVDLDFQFGQLPLFLIDPFLKGIVKNSDGALSGDLKLVRSPNLVEVNGALTMKDFKTTAVISNMQYLAENATVQILENTVDIGSIILKDAKDNSAVLSGRILHNYFQDIEFDLDFTTDEFQFLNTTVTDNDLYYGDLFLKANVEITGTPKLPVLEIDAQTLANSNLFVQPFSDDAAVQQESYIIFANPDNYNEDSILIVEKRIKGNNNNFDLSLQLQVTNDAILNIIIDPVSEDQLISVGTANLTLNINPAGIMTVAGNYTIDNGSYSLNYEQLVKRQFGINKGSSINFSGDPMNASFDVTASYKVRTSTYELLANQSTMSEAEINTASVRTDVVVLMKLKGSLKEPEISFDILVPDAQTDGVSNAVNRKLAELRQNPEELNKQAFGLLLFKSFIAESNSSQTFSDAGTALALSSVSSLLSDQLNQFADRYIEGFEVDFDVESYNTSGAQSQNVTKMQMSISKNLFNDRLNVKVGTNVNLGAQDASSIFSSDFSGIAGDFILEYQLTEKGNYHVKVFHKSDYNVLEQNNAYKTGAGIIFRKSFNSKKYKE